MFLDFLVVPVAQKHPQAPRIVKTACPELTFAGSLDFAARELCDAMTRARHVSSL